MLISQMRDNILDCIGRLYDAPPKAVILKPQFESTGVEVLRDSLDESFHFLNLFRHSRTARREIFFEAVVTKGVEIFVNQQEPADISYNVVKIQAVKTIY